MSAVCETCHTPIVIVSGLHDPGPARFEHDGPPANHPVEPKPLCPKCNSLSYAHYQTNWGYGWKCPDCRHDEYYSIGD